jgi:hypothetical protein
MFDKVTNEIGALPNLTPNGHADAIERCPLLGDSGLKSELRHVRFVPKPEVAEAICADLSPRPCLSHLGDPDQSPRDDLG